MGTRGGGTLASGGHFWNVAAKTFGGRGVAEALVIAGASLRIPREAGDGFSPTGPPEPETTANQPTKLALLLLLKRAKFSSVRPESHSSWLH